MPKIITPIAKGMLTIFTRNIHIVRMLCISLHMHSISLRCIALHPKKLHPNGEFDISMFFSQPKTNKNVVVTSKYKNILKFYRKFLSSTHTQNLCVCGTQNLRVLKQKSLRDLERVRVYKRYILSIIFNLIYFVE